MAASVPKLIKGLQSWSLNNVSVLKQVSRGIHSEPQVTALENGVRVVTQESSAPAATVGLYVNTGARYETSENNGVGYFLEHLAFKGAVDKVAEIGGCVEAVTGREQTGFYTKCLPEGVSGAVDILSGVLNSQFTDADVAAEKGKILQELSGIEESNLKSVVFDHLHSVAFQQSDLGKSVYGPSENVTAMTKETLSSYVKQHYQGNRLVLAAAGGVSHSQLVDLAKKHLGGVGNDTGVTTGVTSRYTGSEVKYRDDSMKYAHVALAVEGCGADSPDRAPLLVAATLLGSWSRSDGGGTNLASKLARQTAALDSKMHSYESFSINYKDTGLWGIYWVCDKLGSADMTWVVQDEWKRIATSASEFEVERAKNQILAHMCGQDICTTATCNTIAAGVLGGGSLTASQIKAVNAKAVKNAVFDYVYDQCPAVAAVGPVENQTDYNRVRAGMTWVRW